MHKKQKQWASAEQIARMMGFGMTIKAADFLQRKLKNLHKKGSLSPAHGVDASEVENIRIVLC